jgi:hypothetical protein
LAFFLENQCYHHFFYRNGYLAVMLVKSKKISNILKNDNTYP